MNDTITISLIPTAELPAILPLVKMLNPDIDEAVLARRLEEMPEQGYQCAGAYCEGQLIGICGLWIATRFYCGKYLEPDNVVVHPDFRSLGVGQKLMALGLRLRPRVKLRSRRAELLCRQPPRPQVLL